MDEEQLAKLASSFGGGMGRLREVCGAVSGMFMIAGAADGYAGPETGDAKTEHYVSYELTGDDNAPAMNGIIIKCNTHKCTKVVTLKNFTEGQIKSRANAQGKCYL